MKGFLDIDCSRIFKHQADISGDVFLTNRQDIPDRLVCTLSDGLGSGVKANVLANLTATMAQKYVLNNIDLERAARIIMDTLPVCSRRKISYSTFSILDIDAMHYGRIIEYDNPSYIFMKGSRLVDPEKREISLGRDENAARQRILHYSEVKLEVGDRLIVCTDGVTQSGMGSHRHPLGWRRDKLIDFVQNNIEKKPEISSRELGAAITRRAHSLDGFSSKDDITCSVLYCRRPRHTLVVSGPPFDMSKDDYLLNRIRQFGGKRIICGGTTASIAAKRLGTSPRVDISTRSNEIPPIAHMEGFDLVTEGMLTLNRTAALLQEQSHPFSLPKNGAEMLLNQLLESDRVTFIVGTRINEAHQNPDMPQDMGIRRTLVRRIANLLKTNYLKEAEIEFI